MGLVWVPSRVTRKLSVGTIGIGQLLHLFDDLVLLVFNRYLSRRRESSIEIIRIQMKLEREQSH